MAAMRRPRSTARAVALAMLATALVLHPHSARAFHEGGVGQCDGCHTMHAPASSTFLLGASDPSSVCLGCHADSVQRPYTVMTTGSPSGFPPVNYTPGGDFGWLLKTFQWIDQTGAPRFSNGERHGHSVVAVDFGLLPDAARLVAPGGTYAANRLSCVSCHDPHGRYRITDAGGTVSTEGTPIRGSGSHGSGGIVDQPTPGGALGVYRMLGGVGYQPTGSGQPFFSAPPPVAVAPPAYNRSERSTQVRVAYGARMSEWCGNCHGQIHTPYAPSSGGLLHAAGDSASLGATVTSIYNSYVKTGDLSGAQPTSYLSLVPYEEGTTDRMALAGHASSDVQSSEGPRTGLENVTCLSCHRAHATAWDHAMRWNQDSEFIVLDGQWPGIDAVGTAARSQFAQGRTVAETRGAMYERNPAAFATHQNTLCNKCHAK
jgi:predicted CXXCH cytochrome family protein